MLFALFTLFIAKMNSAVAQTPVNCGLNILQSIAPSQTIDPADNIIFLKKSRAIVDDEISKRFVKGKSSAWSEAELRTLRKIHPATRAPDPLLYLPEEKLQYVGEISIKDLKRRLTLALDDQESVLRARAALQKVPRELLPAGVSTTEVETFMGRVTSGDPKLKLNSEVISKLLKIREVSLEIMQTQERWNKGYSSWITDYKLKEFKNEPDVAKYAPKIKELELSWNAKKADYLSQADQNKLLVEKREQEKELESLIKATPIQSLNARVANVWTDLPARTCCGNDCAGCESAMYRNDYRMKLNGAQSNADDLAAEIPPSLQFLYSIYDELRVRLPRFTSQ